MIVLRNDKGVATKLTANFKFVEIRDLEGNLAFLVVHVSDTEVKVYQPTDPEFASYCSRFNLSLSKVTKVSLPEDT